MTLPRSAPPVLRAALRRRLAGTGEAIAPGLTIRIVPGTEAIAIGPPDDLPPARCRRRQVDAPFARGHAERPTNEFLEAGAAVSRAVDRARIRAAALEADGAGDAPGPGWSLLAHPLTIALVAMARPGGAGEPWTEGDDHPARLSGISVDGDVVQVAILNVAIGGTTATLQSKAWDESPDRDGSATTLALIPGPFTGTLAAACVGRPLASVVAIAPTGRADVDGAVAGLAIARIRTGAAVALIDVAPTRWLPWAPPPPGRAPFGTMVA